MFFPSVQKNPRTSYRNLQPEIQEEHWKNAFHHGIFFPFSARPHIVSPPKYSFPTERVAFVYIYSSPFLGPCPARAVPAPEHARLGGLDVSDDVEGAVLEIL